jgi:hypothetical protein
MDNCWRLKRRPARRRTMLLAPSAPMRKSADHAASRPNRCVQKRRIERRAAGDEESAFREGNDRLRILDRIGESRGSDRRDGEGQLVSHTGGPSGSEHAAGRHVRKRAGDERERAARDAAPTRFFARVGVIEDCHARAALRELISGPRTRRARADDGDMHRDRLPSEVVARYS